MVRKNIILIAVIVINVLLLVGLSIIAFKVGNNYFKLKETEIEQENILKEINDLNEQVHYLTTRAEALQLKDEEINNLLKELKEINNEKKQLNEDIEKYQQLIKDVEKKLNNIT